MIGLGRECISPAALCMGLCEPYNMLRLKGHVAYDTMYIWSHARRSPVSGLATLKAGLGMDDTERSAPMEETEQAKKNLDELIDEQGGAAALRRRTGISDLTIRKIRRGERVPFVGTATRMAEGLGVDIAQIDWPCGYATAPGQRPKAILDDLYEDGALKAEIANLIEREVQRRMAADGGARTAERQLKTWLPTTEEEEGSRRREHHGGVYWYENTYEKSCQ